MSTRFAALATGLLLALTAGAISHASAQPLDLALFNAQQGTNLADSRIDTVHHHTCLAYLPLAVRPADTGYNQGRWRQLPDQRVDTTRPAFSYDFVRIFAESSSAVFTPPDAGGDTRLWFASNGLYAWDSAMHRATRHPLCPHHAVVPPSTADWAGSIGLHASVILPVRDTPGVFRHVALGYSRAIDRATDYGYNGSYDRAYVYRVDARADAAFPEPHPRAAGPTPRLRYGPRLLGPDDHLGAVAWEGDARPFDTLRDAARDGPLPTISSVVPVAHGNGRDWWLFATGGQSCRRAVAVFLLDTRAGAGAGALRLHALYPRGWPYAPEWYGRHGYQIAVSPDGATVAAHSVRWDPPDDVGFEWRYTPWGDTVGGGLAVWDFDRCAGRITRTRHVDLAYHVTPHQDRGQGVVFDNGNGVAFSESGRWLYYSERMSLARVDLWAADITAAAAEELVIVPEWRSECYDDGQVLTQPLIFHLAVIPGPPGGLLLSHGGGSCRRPFSAWNLDADDAADVVGGYDLFTMPCLNSHKFFGPRYRVYDLAGSPCDTLGIDGPTAGWHDPAWTSSAAAPPTTEDGARAAAPGRLRVWPSPAGAGAAAAAVTVELPAGAWSAAGAGGERLPAATAAEYAPSGARVWAAAPSAVAGSGGRLVVDASAWAAGVYAVVVRRGARVWVGRVVVQ